MPEGRGETELSAAGQMLQGQPQDPSWEARAEWALLKALVSGEASSKNVEVHGGKEIRTQ